MISVILPDRAARRLENLEILVKHFTSDRAEMLKREKKMISIIRDLTEQGEYNEEHYAVIFLKKYDRED